MKLIRGRCYTNGVTDLAIKILKIRHITEDYVKVQCMLFNKKDGTKYGKGIYWDKPLEQKLYYKNIKDWVVYKPKFRI